MNELMSLWAFGVFVILWIAEVKDVSYTTLVLNVVRFALGFIALFWLRRTGQFRLW